MIVGLPPCGVPLKAVTVCSDDEDSATRLGSARSLCQLPILRLPHSAGAISVEMFCSLAGSQVGMPLVKILAFLSKSITTLTAGIGTPFGGGRLRQSSVVTSSVTGVAFLFRELLRGDH